MSDSIAETVRPLAVDTLAVHVGQEKADGATGARADFSSRAVRTST